MNDKLTNHDVLLLITALSNHIDQLRERLKRYQEKSKVYEEGQTGAYRYQNLAFKTFSRLEEYEHLYRKMIDWGSGQWKP